MIAILALAYVGLTCYASLRDTSPANVNDPHPSLMARAPVWYQIHASLPWLLYAVWPFSRLVHVWSYPLQYLGRPYILYRRRHPLPRRADVPA